MQRHPERSRGAGAIAPALLAEALASAGNQPVEAKASTDKAKAKAFALHAELRETFILDFCVCVA